MDIFAHDAPRKPAATGARFWWPYLAALLLIAADRASKIWVEQNLGPALSGKQTELPLGILLRYQENTGAAFSFLRGQPWIFTIIAIVVAIAMIVFYQTRRLSISHDIWYQLAFGLILGGVIGNLVDRLTKEGGAVTDFVVVTWARVGDWQFAVFNVADSGITVGVTVLIVVTLLRSLFGHAKEAPASPTQESFSRDTADGQTAAAIPEPESTRRDDE